MFYRPVNDRNVSAVRTRPKNLLYHAGSIVLKWKKERSVLIIIVRNKYNINCNNYNADDNNNNNNNNNYDNDNNDKIFL